MLPKSNISIVENTNMKLPFKTIAFYTRNEPILVLINLRFYLPEILHFQCFTMYLPCRFVRIIQNLSQILYVQCFTTDVVI